MAEHWQREIAYFDLFIAFVFGWSATQADIRIKRAATMLVWLVIAVGRESSGRLADRSQAFSCVVYPG
jgi:hypothetical protein